MKCIELIASENFTSRAVMECQNPGIPLLPAYLKVFLDLHIFCKD